MNSRWSSRRLSERRSLALSASVIRGAGSYLRTRAVGAHTCWSSLNCPRGTLVAGLEDPACWAAPALIRASQPLQCLPQLQLPAFSIQAAPALQGCHTHAECRWPVSVPPPPCAANARGCAAKKSRGAEEKRGGSLRPRLIRHLALLGISELRGQLLHVFDPHRLQAGSGRGSRERGRGIPASLLWYQTSRPGSMLCSQLPALHCGRPPGCTPAPARNTRHAW